MSLAQILAEELKWESQGTRKYLDRIPENEFEFRPHPRSMNMRLLASHLAEIPSWVAPAFMMTEMVLDPASYKPWIAANKSELMTKFEESLASALHVLSQQDDASLQVQWTLKMGDRIVLSLPRAGVVRSMILNHICHHRGQLSVYLRMRDIPVPSVYGPSADERGNGF